MENILVTGGLGMIGAFICRALIANSRRPVIYDAGSSTGFIDDIVADCVIERGDICDMPRIMGVISRYKPAAIVHFAGHVGPTVEQLPWSSLNTNLMGTTTIFECARLSGVSRIVFPSSRMIYGSVAQRHQHPLYEPVPEEHPRKSPKLYGKIKRALEDIGDHYARLYGLDIVALRFGSAYAPGKFGRNDAVSPVMGLIEAAIANRPFRVECGAEQRDDLCYSGESANGVMAALNSSAQPGKFRVYNIASGELISLQEMIDTLKELYPSWQGEVGPGLDYRRMGVGYYFKMATDKAHAEIGFRPKFNFRSAAIDYARTLARLGAR